MSLDVAAWLLFAAAACVGGYWMGYLTGRESAEAKWQATVADLRIELRHLRGDKYLTADERRPE